jgi:uncharacterized protein YdcH (DUF465 family)
MKIRVQENDRLVRDTRNFAILNTDRSVLRDHERKMRQISKQKSQEEEINTLRREVSEIKDMIAQLLKSK